MSSRTATKWTANKVLVFLTLILGAGATLGDPHAGDVVTLDTRELALIVEGEVDHVTVHTLADRIIKGASDYRLLDVRSDSAFTEYHIPTAEHVTLSALPDYPLFRNEQVILYSDGGIHAAQAWFLLRARGYHATYILLGGLDAWKDEVLFPTPAENPSPEQRAEFDRLRYVSTFFGGSPRSGPEWQSERSAVVLPKLDASAQPVVRQVQKKRKEGC